MFDVDWKCLLPGMYILLLALTIVTVASVIHHW